MSARPRPRPPPAAARACLPPSAVLRERRSPLALADLQPRSDGLQKLVSLSEGSGWGIGTRQTRF